MNGYANAKTGKSHWTCMDYKWNDSALSDYGLLYADNAVEVSTIANKLIHISHGQVKGKKTFMIIGKHFGYDYLIIIIPSKVLIYIKVM